jgi:hypothetical protein
LRQLLSRNNSIGSVWRLFHIRFQVLCGPLKIILAVQHDPQRVFQLGILVPYVELESFSGAFLGGIGILKTYIAFNA